MCKPCNIILFPFTDYIQCENEFENDNINYDLLDEINLDLFSNNENDLTNTVDNLLQNIDPDLNYYTNNFVNLTSDSKYFNTDLINKEILKKKN